MSFIKIVSGSPIRNSGGSTVVTGTTSSVLNAIGMDKIGSKQINTTPKDVTEVDKAKTSRTFAKDTNDPITFLTTTIGGEASTALAHGKTVPAKISSYVQDERLHITSISMSGTPTFGGSRGVATVASGIDTTLGRNADNAIRGEFNYGIGGMSNGGVVNADY